MISKQYIERLLQSIDIVDVVSQFVELKKSGKNYTGLCPFHEEKSPSFGVIPDKQFYNCFGCGASGDAIDFLKGHGHSFKSAVDLLSSMAGLTPEKDSRVVVPRKIKEDLQMDKIILLMAKEKPPVTYADKQRI